MQDIRWHKSFAENHLINVPQANKTRTRLSPEVRKRLILDHAAELVANEGVSAVTMERLAREADISKSLVYSYFPSLIDLLQELLKREHLRMWNRQVKAIQGVETFEQLVRVTTNTYLTYMDERGLIIDRLAAEPSIADSGDPTDFSRNKSVRFMAQIISDNFGIDMDTATIAVDISYGIPYAAGHYLTRHTVNKQKVEDLTVAMMIGSIEGLRKGYENSFKPLVIRDSE